MERPKKMAISEPYACMWTYAWACVYVYNRERENILSRAVDFLSCTYSKNEVRIGLSDAETSIRILEEMNRGTWKSDSDPSVGNGPHTRPNLSQAFCVTRNIRHAVRWNDGDQEWITLANSWCHSHRLCSHTARWPRWGCAGDCGFSPKQPRKSLGKLFQSANDSRL